MTELLVKTSGLNAGQYFGQHPDQKSSSIDNVKTVMLIHGWGMNSCVWEPVREVLESRYHVLWIDLPGHGFNQDFSAKNLQHIVDLIAKVTPNETHIIGWSLGGMVAQSLAQKFPQKVDSLTMVTSTLRFSQSENGDWSNAMSNEVLNRFADNLTQDTMKTVKGFIALQFMGIKHGKEDQDKLINHILKNDKSRQKWGGVFLNGSDDDIQKEKQRVNNIPTKEALDVGLEILQTADLRSLNAKCPEHWVFAEYDRLIPKDVINDLKSMRPNAQITMLEKSGHAPFISHPDYFLDKVTQFIDAQP